MCVGVYVVCVQGCVPQMLRPALALALLVALCRAELRKVLISVDMEGVQSCRLIDLRNPWID